MINNFDVIGTFINTPNVSKINVSIEEFTISKSLEIFNVTSSQKIGKIEISNWKHLFGFKNYIEYLDIKYIFELIQNKDKYSFFHKKTWNKFSFKLYHKNYFTSYEISFDKPCSDFTPISLRDKLNIKVTQNECPTVLIFAGIKLIEDYFENMYPAN